MRPLLTLAFLLLCAVSAASATPLIYTETFTASGTLGAKAFTNQQITLTFTGDTANVAVVNEGGFDGGYDVSVLEGTGDTTVSIAGMSTYTVSGAMELYDYGAYDSIPFLAFESESSATFDSGLSSDAFGCDGTQGPYCYTLQSALGPLTSFTTPSASGYLNTSGGKLTITSKGATKPSDYTFTVTEPPPAVTPEPSSFILLGTGLAAMLGIAIPKHRPSLGLKSS